VRKTKIFNQTASNHVNTERLSACGDSWPTDAGSAIADNWVAGNGFVGNPVAGYGVAGTWGAGYGVAGVPATDDVLSATGSPFTLGILINTLMCYMFLQIDGHILYILVKLPLILPFVMAVSKKQEDAEQQVELHRFCI
jgi:hypothetical protein